MAMLITAAILAIFVYGMIAAMLGTILPDLSDRFRLTPTQNGTIAFSQALGLIAIRSKRAISSRPRAESARLGRNQSIVAPCPHRCEAIFSKESNISSEPRPHG